MTVARSSFQSTLPARGATCDGTSIRRTSTVSIHAPREGSDNVPVRLYGIPLRFNPRSPRGERQNRSRQLNVQSSFNPRSPRGERPEQQNRQHNTGNVSIHAPREGSDLVRDVRNTWQRVSIHAPREGSDARWCGRETYGNCFNPRSPRGERPLLVIAAPILLAFQSTLPARGATHIVRVGCPAIRVSIHAPREGSDRIAPSSSAPALAFQSTLPARGATWGTMRVQRSLKVSIHAPREGSDFHTLDERLDDHPFQSTLPARGATIAYVPPEVAFAFQSTLPARGATQRTNE